MGCKFYYSGPPMKTSKPHPSSSQKFSHASGISASDLLTIFLPGHTLAHNGATQEGLPLPLRKLGRWSTYPPTQGFFSRPVRVLFFGSVGHFSRVSLLLPSHVQPTNKGIRSRNKRGVHKRGMGFLLTRIFILFTRRRVVVVFFLLFALGGGFGP